MGISFDKTAIPGSFPVFWGECKVLPGDFKLKQTFTTGALLRQGLPIKLDFDNMECGVVKVAKVLAGGTTTIPRVTKNHVMEVGDVVMKIGVTTIARTITAIDKTSSDDYDSITLDGAIAGLTTGDFLQESSALAAATAEVKGVYTLTISTAPTADDVLTVDGVDYTYAAAEGDNAYAVGSNAKDAANNIEDALSAQYDGIFSVVSKNGKIIFTQLVGGTGDIPVISVTQTGGTLVAAIVETTAGVAAVAALTAPVYDMPDTVLAETKEYTTPENFQTVSAGYEVLILKEVAYPIPSTWLNGFSLKNNAAIKYIKQ